MEDSSPKYGSKNLYINNYVQENEEDSILNCISMLPQSIAI